MQYNYRSTHKKSQPCYHLVTGFFVFFLLILFSLMHFQMITLVIA